MKATQKGVRYFFSLSLILMVFISMNVHVRHAYADSQKKVYHLRMQTLVPEVDPLCGVCCKRFVQRVKTLSGGRLEIDLFPVDTVVPVFGMADAAIEGALDLILWYGGWWAGRIGPIAELETGLPVSFKSHVDVANYFYHFGFADMLRDIYKKQGVYYIGYVSGGSSTVFVKKPIGNAADLRGMKIMEAGVEARYYALLGASAVPIAAPGEIYTALATGVVDGVGWAGPRTMVRALKLQEVAKYVFWPPTNWETRLQLIMNNRKWEQLPDDLKQVLVDSTKLLSWEASQFFVREDSLVLKELQENAGVKFVSVKETEREKAAAQIREEFAKNSPDCAKAIEIEKNLLSTLY